MERGDRPFSVDRRSLHVQYKVTARSKVPRLDDDRVASLLQHPCDPLCLGAIVPGVADEEVFHGKRWGGSWMQAVGRGAHWLLPAFNLCHNS